MKSYAPLFLIAAFVPGFVVAWAKIAQWYFPGTNWDTAIGVIAFICGAVLFITAVCRRMEYNESESEIPPPPTDCGPP